MNTTRALITAAALIAAASTQATAQETATARAREAGKKNLSIVVTNKTAQAEAAKTGKPVERAVRPGDVLGYKVIFVNHHKTSIKNVRIDGPVPKGTSLSEGSGQISRSDVVVHYAADGKSVFEVEPMEKVVVDGKSETKKVPAERFTTLRWIIAGNVMPGDTVKAEYEVTVKSRPAAAKTGNKK